MSVPLKYTKLNLVLMESQDLRESRLLYAKLYFVLFFLKSFHKMLS